MPSNPAPQFDNLRLYFGDLHNHCGASYGNGSLADAITNAQLQLDFVSITLHAAWPDIPEEQEELSYLVNYHKAGFERAKQNWHNYLIEVDKKNKDGSFVVFPSYEWHSKTFGDHCIYYKNGLRQSILDAPDLASLRNQLNQLQTETFLIPHHIGYKQGYRGINWSTFTEQLSPVVEIFSFHGCSESSDGPYPYLHTMGPRHDQSCAQYGWSQGKIFGLIGSTDHHNAFPGSYGSGRMGVWAEELTRNAIWEAIRKRRTYALTGDRIELKFAINEAIMGDVFPYTEDRHISVSVIGGDSIDCIDVLHNNKIIHRESPLLEEKPQQTYKIYLELGWGELPEDTLWDVKFNVTNGEILSVEPRFRGYGSQGQPLGNKYAYTQWEQVNSHQVKFTTRTRPNASLHTATTEGMSFEVQGNQNTSISTVINHQEFTYQLSELISGSRTHYLGGFVSPAICMHRAKPASEYTHKFEFLHKHKTNQQDWYYIRVRQKNDQWAWSSPIWIEKP